MRNRILGIVFFSCILFSCKKNDQPIPLAAVTTLNDSYGTDALQKFDIYLPQGRNKDTTKVIVLIHGGAWSGGDKADVTPIIDSLKKYFPGYAYFNINYRLANGVSNGFPTQETDVKAAMDYIFSKQDVYQISNKVALIGFSAGAHLSLLQGYKYSTPVKPKVIADFFGPTDMVEMYNNPASGAGSPLLIAALMGGTPTSNASLYQSSSPINFATSTSPATIIFQGGVDNTVRPSQSETLQFKLVSLGVPNKYVFYPSQGHGWTGTYIQDSFNWLVKFLNENLK